MTKQTSTKELIIIQISLPFYLPTRLQGDPPIQDDMTEQEP